MRLNAEAMNLFYAFTHDHVHLNEDELTLQFLGLRLFNSAAASIKLGMSGYAQTAISLVRDILEISFLLDYFKSDPSKIPEWKNATAKERKTKFSPVNIRIALDTRDGFKEKRRAEVYELLSEHASHVSYGGFKLIRSDGLGNLGPFIDEKILKAWVQELTLRLVPGATIFAIFFVDASPPLQQLRMKYIDQVRAWQERMFKQPKQSET
jgi:hypothetical protein